ncbi:MAG: sodium:proton exchanger [Ignavibacteria bacterium]|jgi:CPA2 family monovalent cation:H+ antiporter-2|nr:sodium:proton exchanger [Ignavibacteria bacterium]MCU7501179.1 sodium:proton exchanger [Ignavibacteria bacterium]MCU7514604.1 sodium:proton exchanger [Ignavibacteria bacterium]MCU7521977.1 sodium:proton exchanger [Ignavibacteria bacterium]MCU7526483.1 sodium:proton exchanger [Ignavibacteria bacterium]
MQHIPIIKVLVIIFLASLPIIFLFRKLNLPSIAGFLVAGIIIGPYGFRLITGAEAIRVMAEIGIILLLFTIGLEVSVGKLVQMKRFLILAGGSQVLGTIALSALISGLMGIPVNQSIFFGMLISMSSTAIVLKLLSDRNELDTPQGKISLGVLIFQDLAVVPMIILLPLLGNQTGLSLADISVKLLIAFGILGAVIFVARYVMPELLFQVAKLRMREAFTIGVMLLILGAAYLTESLGLSLALGAFIAGVILSDTEFSHQVAADIVPLKDAFNSLFFVSIGLLLDYGLIAMYPLEMLGLTLGIIIIKFAVVFLITRFLKYPSRVAFLTALSLAQIGEFSFVLLQSGLQMRLINAEFYNAFLSASIFTMLITPLLLQAAPKLALGLKDQSFKKNLPDESAPRMKGHVIIAGFGLNGRNIARVLKETGIGYIVMELNPVTVKESKKQGERIIYGDVTRREVLEYANCKEASVLVFAISDLISTRAGIKLAKEMNPSIYCIVRTRFISEVDNLIKLGADEVIPEEFETSLQIFSKVLEKYHIPINVVMKQANIIRSESYGFFRKEVTPESMLSHIDKILAEGVTEIYFVEESNPNTNKKLSELNLRARTGATVIAFQREDRTIANPSGDEVILAGDSLILYGTHMSVDKAISLLNS